MVKKEKVEMKVEEEGDLSSLADFSVKIFPFLRLKYRFKRLWLETFTWKWEQFAAEARSYDFILDFPA